MKSNDSRTNIYSAHSGLKQYTDTGFSGGYGIVYGDRQTVNHILEMNFMMRRGA